MVSDRAANAAYFCAAIVRVSDRLTPAAARSAAAELAPDNDGGGGGGCVLPPVPKACSAGVCALVGQTMPRAASARRALVDLSGSPTSPATDRPCAQSTQRAPAGGLPGVCHVASYDPSTRAPPRRVSRGATPDGSSATGTCGTRAARARRPWPEAAEVSVLAPCAIVARWLPPGSRQASSLCRRDLMRTCLSRARGQPASLEMSTWLGRDTPAVSLQLAGQRRKENLA